MGGGGITAPPATLVSASVTAAAAAAEVRFIAVRRCYSRMSAVGQWGAGAERARVARRVARSTMWGGRGAAVGATQTTAFRGRGARLYWGSPAPHRDASERRRGALAARRCWHSAAGRNPQPGAAAGGVTRAAGRRPCLALPWASRRQTTRSTRVALPRHPAGRCARGRGWIDSEAGQRQSPRAACGPPWGSLHPDPPHPWRWKRVQDGDRLRWQPAPSWASDPWGEPPSGRILQRSPDRPMRGRRRATGQRGARCLWIPAPWTSAVAVPTRIPWAAASGAWTEKTGTIQR